MARVYTYVLITVGLMIVLNIAGLETTSGHVLGALGLNVGNYQNLESNSLWAAIGAVILGLAATAFGIQVGFIRVGSLETPVVALSLGTRP